MALPAAQKSDDSPHGSREHVACPVCAGKMEVVYDRHHQKVVVCIDCQSGLTVPVTAWEIARIKREARRMPNR